MSPCCAPPPTIVLPSPCGRRCHPCPLVVGDVGGPTGDLGVPLPAEEGGPWVTRCLAVLGTCWGGGGPVLPAPSPCVPHPQPASPLPETVLRSFSPPCPLEWGGGGQQLLLSTAFGGRGLDTPPPQSGLCLLGGWQPSAPICRGAQEGLTSYHPPKNGGGGCLIGLGAWGHHRTLNSALGAADHIEGGMSLPLPRAFCCPPCLGGVFLGGQPGLRAKPLATNAPPPRALGHHIYVPPPSPVRGVPGGGGS